MNAYKLVRIRRDGSLGPLFINRRLRMPLGKWLRAEDHPTPGYTHRPGWHATVAPHAPHLSLKGRVWCRVLLKGVTTYQRPDSQGGTWFVSKWLRVEKVLT